MKYSFIIFIVIQSKSKPFSGRSFLLFTTLLVWLYKKQTFTIAIKMAGKCVTLLNILIYQTINNVRLMKGKWPNAGLKTALTLELK